MTNVLKNLLIALVIALVLFAGYFFYLKDRVSSEGGETPASTIDTVSVEQRTQQLLARLTLLNSIDIDESVFSDTRFRSLIDFRQDLGKESVGRTNPFAPVNGQ